MRRLDHLGCGLRRYTRMSPARLLLLLSPTALLLLLSTSPQTHAQQNDSVATDIRLMLHMMRRQMMTVGTVLEDVKLITMSVEQMNQRMDTLERTVADIVETFEGRMANQTERIEQEMTKHAEKLEDKIGNQINRLDTNVTRILETMVTDVSKTPMPIDCSDIAKGKNSGSGTYSIFPEREAVHVYCDIEGSEGWTVLQRRINGPQDFDKNWVEYKTGFGDLEGEHWVGNEYMHLLTSHRAYMIQFVLGGCIPIGDVLVANYRVFRVENERSGYKLTVDGFSGNATDGMNGCASDNQNEMKFTTKDRDNDHHSTNCAITVPGAWWFNSCYCSHLNRQGLDGGVVYWKNDSTPKIKCKKTKMRIKPLTS